MFYFIYFGLTTHLAGSQFADQGSNLAVKTLSLGNHWTTREFLVHVYFKQINEELLCLTLCNPMDCSLPGSSVHGIFQVRIPEWVAISSSEESSRLRDQTCVPGIGKWILYHLSHQGSPDEQWQTPNHNLQILLSLLKSHMTVQFFIILFLNDSSVLQCQNIQCDRR